VAEHRGGPLSKQNHRLLALWAADCAEHILAAAWKDTGDERPWEAVRLARAWARGEISVGVAQRAAVDAHAAARACSDDAAKAAARAAGHAVATAHAADHSLGAATYALRAVDYLGGDRDLERRWQDERLPDSIRELVLATRDLPQYALKRLD
jgi:hypothetical protein